MKPKMILKLAVDIGMTAALLLLMAYELVGQAVHEWIGIGMFVLFVIHHILNGSWIRNLLREIQSCAHHADRTCIIDTLRNGRLNGKRNYPVPSCAVFSSHKRRAFFCEESAYDFRLLGICTDVRSSWVSLEHDDGNGKEVFPETVCSTEVGAAHSGTGDCRIWRIRFYKERHRNLYVAQEPFCLFRL